MQTQRWGDQTDDRTFALIPSGGHLKDERRFGDYTIPTQVSACHRKPSKAAEITSATIGTMTPM